MAWYDPEDWTRGDPAAPPHVKDFWLRPDFDAFPQRWTDETETEVVEEDDESVAEIESEWADSTDPDDPWA